MKQLVRRLSTRRPDFETSLRQLLAFEATQDEAIESAVSAILAEVRARGDAAVLDYTRRFDSLELRSAAELSLPAQALADALSGLPETQRAALETAAARIRAFHQKQPLQSWSYT